MSFRQHLSHPTYSGHWWEALALLSAAQRAVPVQVMAVWSLYCQSLHVGLCHPPCRKRQVKPSSFIFCDYAGKSKLNKGDLFERCLRCFILCVGAQRLQEQFLVILTALFPTQSGFLLMEKLGGDSSNEIFLLKLWEFFFICFHSQWTDCKSIFTGKLCREQGLMFF